MAGKLIIIAAPSGSGKTSIVKNLLDRKLNLSFSVSATTRNKRPNETHGVDYFFISEEDFKKKIADNQFLEWEEVYNGTCYGTLKSEMTRIWEKGNVIIFDVDVMGGINLKHIFGDSACSIFIMPPSIEVLRQRLIGRGTDSMETIEKRVAKAGFELSKADEFDHVVVNDILEDAISQTQEIINDFLNK